MNTTMHDRRARPAGRLDQAESVLAVAVLAGLAPVLLVRLLDRVSGAASGPSAATLAGMLGAVSHLVRALGLAVLLLLALYCAARVLLQLASSRRDESRDGASTVLLAGAVGAACLGLLALW
jgi:hypothetical protein